jgi:hypothetical protein
MKLLNNFTKLILLFNAIGMCILTSDPANAKKEPEKIKCDQMGNSFYEDPHKLKNLPSYVSNNLQQYIYHFHPNKAVSGDYTIIMKDRSLCKIDTQSINSSKDRKKAIRKFSEIYPGSNPAGICEANVYLDVIKCTRRL